LAYIKTLKQIIEVCTRNIVCWTIQFCYFGKSTI